MTQTKPRRTQRPMLCAGAPISHRKLASASLPARVTGHLPVQFEMGEQKPAYRALFETALQYGPAEASEGLAMAMVACLRTLQKSDMRTALTDTKTGEKMVLEVKLIRESDPPPSEPKKRRKKAH